VGTPQQCRLCSAFVSVAPPVTYAGSFIRGSSRDGRVLVGHVSLPDGNRRAFRWLLETRSFEFYPNMTTSSTIATGASADGSIVVGYTEDTIMGRQTFRWTIAPNMAPVVEPIAPPPGTAQSAAFAVSADGSIMAGTARIPPAIDRAWRWEAGRFDDLGALAGDGGNAYSISGDGRFIAGTTSEPQGAYHAYRYDWQTRMSTLLTSTAGDVAGGALDISLDGQVVVGNYLGDVSRAARWDANGVLTLLPLFAEGAPSQAMRVNADGRVIVGVAGDPRVAVIWTDDRVSTIAGQLGDRGVLIPAGWLLSNATALSADGRIVAGVGAYLNQPDVGWVAVLADVCPSEG
jgi:uncharacterized membrane protein